MRALASERCGPSARGVEVASDERMKVPVSRAPTLSCLRAVVSRGTAPTTQGSERCAPSRRASDELLNVSASRAPTLSAGRRS